MFHVRCPYCDREIEKDDPPPPDVKANEEWEETCPHCGLEFAVWWEPCYETRPLVHSATHIPTGTSQYPDTFTSAPDSSTWQG